MRAFSQRMKEGCAKEHKSLLSLHSPTSFEFKPGLPRVGPPGFPESAWPIWSLEAVVNGRLEPQHSTGSDSAATSNSLFLPSLTPEPASCQRQRALAIFQGVLRTVRELCIRTCTVATIACLNRALQRRARPATSGFKAYIAGTRWLR